MNTDSAKRVLALIRQRKSYLALVKSGDLRQSEADQLTAMCDREIEHLRQQQVLLDGAAHLAASVTPAKGSK